MNPCAKFTSSSCWKLINHLDEFISGEAVKGERGDEAAIAWATEMRLQATRALNITRDEVWEQQRRTA